MYGMHCLPPDWPGLTDEQWRDVSELLLPSKKRPWRRALRKGGRPRASDKRAFEAILYGFSGYGFERLPGRFGSRRTAFRRMKEWMEGAVLEKMWQRHFAHWSLQEMEDWHRAMDWPLHRRSGLWRLYVPAVLGSSLRYRQHLAGIRQPAA